MKFKETNLVCRHCQEIIYITPFLNPSYLKNDSTKFNNILKIIQMDPDRLKSLKELAQLGEVRYFTKNKKYIITAEEPRQLKTQADAILYFLQKLDIEMVNSILEDNRTYQDFPKKKFIDKLDDAIDDFLKSGDTFLHAHSGYCNSEKCNFKCKGYTFIGNKSNNYFDLIFDIKEGIVNDIYECTKFKCNEKGLNKNIQIEIDPSNMPF